MNDAVFVGGHKRAGDLNGRVQQGPERQRPVVHFRPQGFARHVLADDIEVVVELFEGVDGGDSRVRKGCGGLGLPPQAVPALIVTRKLPGERLDRDRAAQSGIVGQVHHAHPTLSELSGHDVLSEASSNQRLARPDLGSLGSRCVCWRIDEAARLFVVGKERGDLSPQRGIARAGFVDEGGAARWVVLQRGVEELVESVPAFRIH